jgi:MFS family permease
MKLWNRNFTILAIGSFISALGSSAAGFGFGILIFTKTGSPLTLAIFTVANVLPRVITNIVIGPFIDRNSRKKIIVSIDFFYTIIFGAIAMILFTGYFDVLAFTLIAAFFGVLDTIYQTAFMSLYPDAIPKGFHSKAYSFASLIWPISAAIMAPTAAFMIATFEDGIAILMAFNAITFLVTATLETTINIKEKLNKKVVSEGIEFINDFKEGIKYYHKEKGVLGIGILFAAFSFVYASQDLLRMPYFINHDIFSLQHFSFLITAGAVGRVSGGIIHYFFKYPPHKRFLIAVTVYFSVELLGATMLFMPYFLMIIVSFTIGILSVTSFNIRMSATQTYIPADMRGRINSTQQLMWNAGAIIGALIIGVVAEFSGLDFRTIIVLTSTVSITAIFFIPIRMKNEFKNIYNQDV